MINLYDIWDKDSTNFDLGTKQKTAEALKNKTYQITRKGILSYMNRPTSDLDLSKDFIVIDMSNVPAIIKDAMSVLVTGMLHSRFSPDNDRDTIIAMDEAGVYLRDPKQAGDMLTTLTQGRSHGVYLGLCTHQPSDFTKNGMREEFQTNMFCNIILGANIKNAVDDVGKYFNLSEEEKETLIACGDDEGARQGEGLLLVKGQKIPIRFEPTELENRVIKGTFQDEEKTSLDGGFMVYPELQKLCEEQRIIFSNWCQGDHSTLLSQGYEKRKIQKVSGNGTMIAYVPVGMVTDDEKINLPHLGKMSFTHYCSVVQLAALLILEGYQNVRINHSGKVDIESEKEGKSFAFEYETNVHDGKELIKKLEKALKEYDFVRFVCNSTDASFIKRFVGKYLITRGSQVTDFIENPFAVQGNEPTEPSTEDVFKAEEKQELEIPEIPEIQEAGEEGKQEQENFIQTEAIVIEASV